ncbi:MAG: hypothetical protein WCA20_21940 [Candidatus Sulfotelmatobacter sp.]
MPALNRCEEGGKPEDDHETSHKYVREGSLPQWCGWHAFRRGLATNLHDLGVHDKTIQAVLRHSNVAVTQGAYIKTLPKQTLDAMDKLNARAVGEVIQRLCNKCATGVVVPAK